MLTFDLTVFNDVIVRDSIPILPFMQILCLVFNISCGTGINIHVDIRIGLEAAAAFIVIVLPVFLKQGDDFVKHLHCWLLKVFKCQIYFMYCPPCCGKSDPIEVSFICPSCDKVYKGNNSDDRDSSINYCKCKCNSIDILHLYLMNSLLAFVTYKSGISNQQCCGHCPADTKFCCGKICRIFSVLWRSLAFVLSIIIHLIGIPIAVASAMSKSIWDNLWDKCESCCCCSKSSKEHKRDCSSSADHKTHLIEGKSSGSRSKCCRCIRKCIMCTCIFVLFVLIWFACAYIILILADSCVIAIQILLYTLVGFVINTDEVFPVVTCVVIGLYYLVSSYRDLHQKYINFKKLVFNDVTKTAANNTVLSKQKMIKYNTKLESHQQLRILRIISSTTQIETEPREKQLEKYLKAISKTENQKFDKIPKLLWEYMYTTFLPLETECGTAVAIWFGQMLVFALLVIAVFQFDRVDHIDSLLSGFKSILTFLMPKIITILAMKVNETILKNTFEKNVSDKVREYIEECQVRIKTQISHPV